MDAVFNVLDKAFDTCRSFGAAEWAVISVTAVLFGYFCLRGMNIR